MIRTIYDTLADLDAMDVAIARMRQVIYAKPFFRSRYDEALARVEADLGPVMTAMRRLWIGAEPEDLIREARALVQGRDQYSDIPQTSPPEGPW